METAAKNSLIERDTMARIIEDPVARREMAKTFLGFCIIYLPHYLRVPPADFHPEMLGLMEDWTKNLLAFAAFRGSAKTTFGSVAFPLWTALERKAHFPIIFNETQDVAEISIANIRHELEENELLIADYGDVSEGISKTRNWTKENILLTNGVRIMGRSRGQKIRGLIHRGYRPDVVVIDDPEERKKVKSEAYRNETENWLRSDIIPATEEFNSRLILLLNLFHRDSLAARLKGDPLFYYREYPLVDDAGKITWRGKYPNMEAVERQKAKVVSAKTGSLAVWMREYQLKIISDDEQEVKEEWIKRYDDLPPSIAKTGVGVDLASSKKQTADYTAMVGGALAYVDSNPKIYVLPHPTNARLTLHETMDEMRNKAAGITAYAPSPIFYIEDVAYQKVAVQEAERRLFAAKGVKVGNDKRSRLKTAAVYIQNGTVLFPQCDCENCRRLINQLLGFGIEDHDDLADAFVLMVLGLAEEGLEMPEVIGLL